MGGDRISEDAIVFAGGALDRAPQVRADAGALDAALRDPAARAVAVGPAGAHRKLLPLRPDDHAGALFLGLAPEGPRFAVERDDVELTGLRELTASLPAGALGVVAYAAALANWARATRFCGRCGEPTEPAEAGHVRVCANGHQHHPRTDPVVIMLVTSGDVVLMGRQASWPEGRYSALAGFVEPGESLEAAVAREVAEEAGVEVTDVRYVASQPWPFPVSLMLGFQATYAGGDPAPRDAELQDVRWFCRDEVAAAAREDVAWEDAGGAGRLRLPPRSAIARVLVERWLGAPAG
ncbi:MAG TPA: NAD(+) diphosphatase [Baekduia sp.]|nr:NAD(+) diphosphatase [Baekduia sp.]